MAGLRQPQDSSREEVKGPPEDYPIIVGGMYPKMTIVGTLPPHPATARTTTTASGNEITAALLTSSAAGQYGLAAAEPMVLDNGGGGDNDDGWDSSVIRHTPGPVFAGNLERRHSGWEAVERQWMTSGGGGGGGGGDDGAGGRAASLLQKQQQQKLPESRWGTSQRDLVQGQIPGELSTGLVGSEIPPPRLELDFQLQMTLNPQVATMASSSDGSKRVTTISGGRWSGTFGQGQIIGGGQDTKNVSQGKTSAIQIEATYRLRTTDEIPAIIECKARGYKNPSTNPPLPPGPVPPTDSTICPFSDWVSRATPGSNNGQGRNALRQQQLQQQQQRHREDPIIATMAAAAAAETETAAGSGTGEAAAAREEEGDGEYRVHMTLRTGDTRYAELVNFGLWVGTGVRRGPEVVYE